MRTFILCAACLICSSCQRLPSVGSFIIAEITTKNNKTAFFSARIDTGAEISSLHAYRIEIPEANINTNNLQIQNMEKHLHRDILIHSQTDLDQKVLIKSQIEDIIIVQNALGEEKRFVIRVPISYKGTNRETTMSISNRSQLRHKLLLGQNWLRNNYIVDLRLDKHHQ